MDGPYFLPQLLVERTGLQDVTWGLFTRVAFTEGRFSYSYSFEVGPLSAVSRAEAEDGRQSVRQFYVLPHMRQSWETSKIKQPCRALGERFWRLGGYLLTTNGGSSPGQTGAVPFCICNVPSKT